MVNMKDLSIDDDETKISIASQIKIKNGSSIQSFNLSTHKSNDSLKFSSKDSKSIDIEKLNLTFESKLKDAYENKICPLCRDVIEKNNQFDQWKEIHQIVSLCYNKENPIKVLFGNKPSDIDEYSKYCLIKELENDDKHNLSFTNNNCIIQ